MNPLTQPAAPGNGVPAPDGTPSTNGARPTATNGAPPTKWVYDLADGSRHMAAPLGGKGAGISEMTRVLGAERVPAGFTVTTAACVQYMRDDQASPPELAAQVADALGRLESQADKRLGDPEDPLLLAVRSGGRVSMPGMLDTVLLERSGLADPQIALA